jgi:opacity protein-like surface antigen
VLYSGEPSFIPAGAAQAGMAYVSVMRNDHWSAFHNQASLALHKGISCGINYENRFGLKETGTCSASIIAGTGRATVGAVYSRFGYSDFSRHMTGIACALPLSDKISAGVQIDWFSEMMYGEYNDKQALTFEAGILINASENIRLGIHLFNPVPDNIRKHEMTSGIRAGAAIALTGNMLAGAELEMTTGGMADLRTGFDFEAAEGFRLRGGYRTMNSSFSFGMGYRVKPAIIDIAFSTHQKLGITSSVSITFIIK